jgi:hypothetical protein
VTVLIIEKLNQSSKRSEIIDELKKITEDMNKNTPKLLNEDIRYDGAKLLSDNLYEYKYTIVSKKSEDEMKDKLEKMETGIQRYVLHDDSMKTFRENLIGVNYVYKDRKGNIIHEIKITPDELGENRLKYPILRVWKSKKPKKNILKHGRKAV